MASIDALNAYGAATAEGIQRCVGNEGLYLRMVNSVPGQKSFGELESALKAGDLDAAFEAAHALKGVLGNLSLTPMYELTSELTELLRARTEMDYGPLLEAFVREKERLFAAIAAEQ